MKTFSIARIVAVAALASLLGCRTAAPPDRPPVSFGEGRPRPETRRDAGRRDGAHDNQAERASREDRGEDQDDRGDRNDRSRRSRPSARSAAGSFDFYLLNLSWSPEFCASHSQSPECGSHLGFIVHGLWPQNNDGTYPEHCGDAVGPSNPGAYRDFMPADTLVRHEWETHGTCSGQPPGAYFGMARKAFHEVKVPPELARLNSETMLPPTAIIEAFARANPSFPSGSLALTCGNNRLTAIEVCMSKTLQPVACESIRSCRAQQVKITPP